MGDGLAKRGGLRAVGLLAALILTAPFAAAAQAAESPLLHAFSIYCLDNLGDVARAEAAARAAGWRDLFPKTGGPPNGLLRFFNAVHSDRISLTGRQDGSEIWLGLRQQAGLAPPARRRKDTCSVAYAPPTPVAPPLPDPDASGTGQPSAAEKKQIDAEQAAAVSDLVRLMGHEPSATEKGVNLWVWQETAEGRRFLAFDSNGSPIDALPGRPVLMVGFSPEQGLLLMVATWPEPLALPGRTVAETQALWALCTRNEDQKTDPSAAIAACNSFIDPPIADQAVLARAYADRGFAHMQKLDAVGSEVDTRAALDIDPGAPTFRLNLARTLVFRAYRMDDEALSRPLYQEAFELLDDLRRQFPADAAKFAEGQYLTATALDGLGRTKEAIPYWARAVALDPKNADALNELCFARVRLRIQLSAALSACNRAISLQPDDPDYLDSRGWVLFAMGRYAPAIADFSAALTLDPKLASSLLGRSLAERALRRAAAADADAAAARALDPKVKSPLPAHH
jgi:tetratricopeptide (TPR) repeat protein